MATARPAVDASTAPRKSAVTGGAKRNRSRALELAPVAASDATPRAAKADSIPEAVEGKAKPKLVRDSFTIPKDEYAVLAELKQRTARLGHPAKKSELLRAGIAVLQAMPDAALLSSLQAVPSLKTGRPKRNAKR